MLAPGEPLGSVVDEDGVVHRVERVDDPGRLAAIGAAVSARPVLIADGHHRYGVSQIYQAERRADAGGAAGPYDLTLAYVGELVEDQLSVEPIHRLLDGLPADRSWPDVLAPWFDAEPGGPATAALAASLVERDAVALVERGGTATLLHPRADAFAGERDLDSVRVERAVDGVPHVLRYQHGVGNVLAALERGEAQAAVLIRPVSVQEIERTAREGLLMPPKSTFFTPKLRTGLVLRSMAGVTPTGGRRVRRGADPGASGLAGAPQRRLDACRQASRAGRSVGGGAKISPPTRCRWSGGARSARPGPCAPPRPSAAG